MGILLLGDIPSTGLMSIPQYGYTVQLLSVAQGKSRSLGTIPTTVFLEIYLKCRENQRRTWLVNLIVRDLPSVFWDSQSQLQNQPQKPLCGAFRSNAPPAIPFLRISPHSSHIFPPFPQKIHPRPGTSCAKATRQLSRQFLLWRLTSSFPWRELQ